MDKKLGDMGARRLKERVDGDDAVSKSVFQLCSVVCVCVLVCCILYMVECVCMCVLVWCVSVYL